MKKSTFAIPVTLAMIVSHNIAAAVDVEFHGDLNHRFQYSNRADLLALDSTSDRAEINAGSVDENFGEIKYRLWVEAATNDGDMKGVVATEIGGLRFGESGKADFSGDDLRFEVRWAYGDIQLPWVERTARFKVGLQPFKVNRYQWQETAAGVAFSSTVGEDMDYVLAWMRGAEYDKTAADSDENDERTDLDSFLLRWNMKPGAIQSGIYLMYQGYDSDGNFGTLDSRDWEVKLFKRGNDPQIGFDLWSIGTDGSMDLGTFFFNWDLIYQNGQFDDVAFTEFGSGTGVVGDFDMSAYFLHFDAGAKLDDKIKLTYTFWYASGDDDPTDDDFEAFLATDVDITDSIALFEGNYADDNYFTERPYLADKGFIMNRAGLDFQATEKLQLGTALLYMMTAEDFEYTAAANGAPVSENEVGWEIDAYVKYQLFPNTEVAFNVGYLFAGDALDVYEVDEIQDGSSDEDILITSARVRYKF
ncbi:MAG TPA: hypothetical protein VJ969_06860 [Desulfopila sp.]|nr:hypothetical protein [Desulfopila sp.]